MGSATTVAGVRSLALDRMLPETIGVGWKTPSALRDGCLTRKTEEEDLFIFDDTPRNMTGVSQGSMV